MEDIELVFSKDVEELEWDEFEVIVVIIFYFDVF